MIKFFRHIRKRMLTENKTSKYLLYAIGEIVLVVIGILIALQINTWNEARKEIQVEKQVLRSLFQDISNDRTMLQAIDSQFEQDRRRLSYFKDFIWKEEHSMSEANALNSFGGFNNQDLNPNRITYDEMISTGKLYYVSNQSLLRGIIDYYKNIESHIYRSRQDRVEFRENYYDVNSMKDFWLAVHDGDDEELWYEFANNQDTEVYKSLKVLSKYSYNLLRTTKGSVVNLLEETKELQLLISEELDDPQLLAEAMKSSDGSVLAIELTTPKKLTDLLSSGASVETIIQTIKAQDKDKPEYDIAERRINDVGYVHMRQKNYADALKIFELNIELYPNAFNVHDSYGECLLNLGDTENSKKAYERSLELNPDNTAAKVALYHINGQKL